MAYVCVVYVYMCVGLVCVYMVWYVCGMYVWSVCMCVLYVCVWCGYV